MWFALLFVALLIPLTAVILDSQIGRALAARLERRRPQEDESVQQRMSLLESEVERLSRDVAQLVEQGEFLHRLLTERPPQSRGELPADHEHDR